jgi:hypothetical protein
VPLWPASSRSAITPNAQGAPARQTPFDAARWRFAHGRASAEGERGQQNPYTITSSTRASSAAATRRVASGDSRIGTLWNETVDPSKRRFIALGGLPRGLARPSGSNPLSIADAAPRRTCWSATVYPDRRSVQVAAASAIGLRKRLSGLIRSARWTLMGAGHAYCDGEPSDSR